MNKKRYLPLIIAVSAGLAVAALTALKQGLFEAASPQEAYKALCDAFFVPGAVLCCLGMLSFVAYGGFFDIFAYAIKSIKHLFIPSASRDHLRYYDYRLEKEARRQKPRYFTLKVGMIFMLLSVIFRQFLRWPLTSTRS